jgi:hypothetical protein
MAANTGDSSTGDGGERADHEAVAVGGAMAVRRRAMKYRSEQVWGSLPVVHVSVGGRQADGRYRLGRARGVIAVGDVATGLVAIGGVAIGLVSVGGVAVGLVALGAVAIGLVAVGAVAIGLFATGGGGDRADGDGRSHRRCGRGPEATRSERAIRGGPRLRRSLRIAGVTDCSMV